MRKAIRLALPVVATATALALTGCSDDGDDGAFGSVGGSSGGSEESSTDAPGSTTGGEETDDAETTDGGSGGEVTTGPTIEELNGDWYESATVDTQNFEIDSATGEVLFYSSFDPAATDLCTGSYANGTITLEDCQSYGGSWSDMSATVALDGDTLNVTWSGGQTASMRNLIAGGFSAEEQSEIGRIIDEFNNG